MQVDIIPAKRLDFYIEGKEFAIVDVRSREEFRKRHLKGAVNIPFDEETRNVDEYKKGQAYILYCDHGNLSLIAAGILTRRGIRVKTVSGGISAYRGVNFVDSTSRHL